jgi:hypothetical protein
LNLHHATMQRPITSLYGFFEAFPLAKATKTPEHKN